MTLRAEIRVGLLSGQKSIDDLFALCPSATEAKLFAQNISSLKAEGKIKMIATSDAGRRGIYAIDKWPEDSLRQAAPGTSVAVRKRNSHPQVLAGPARYAIREDGAMSVEKGDQSITLDLGECARLYTFLDNTEVFWKPEERKRK